METTIPPSAKPTILDSSYPTYEEWKPPYSHLPIFPLCSYPTYEEWKLSNSSSSLVSYPLFYPTYEEWKQSSNDSIPILFKSSFLSYL